MIINDGTTPNDGSGDSLRETGQKLNKSQAVISRTTTAQPGSPSLGDLYIVPVGATGAQWAGEDNKVAWFGTSWEFYTPDAGWRFWVTDEYRLLSWSGAAWASLGTSSYGAKVRNNGGDIGVNWTAPGTRDIWDTADKNEGGWWSLGAASRLTVPSGLGIQSVDISASIYVGALAAGNYCYLAIFKDGQHLVPRLHDKQLAGTVGTDCILSVNEFDVPAVEGEYFECYTQCEEISVNLTANFSSFSIRASG